MKTKTQICQDIISTVARLFGLKAATVTGRLRTRRIVDARFIAMWLCNQKTKLPDRELAELFGKHRCSVSYAIKKVPEWREVDPVFRDMFDMTAEAIDGQETIPVETKTPEPELPEGWDFKAECLGDEQNYPLN